MTNINSNVHIVVETKRNETKRCEMRFIMKRNGNKLKIKLS